IFAYVTNLEPPHAEVHAPSARVERGSAIFHSEEAGCSTCHLGDEALTDSLSHDVKSHLQSDLGHRAFDTPSLRFVGKTAPYFHHGRYATLEAVLRATDGQMGHTSQLGEEDRASLLAYLDSL